MTKKAAKRLAVQIAEVTVFQMFDTIAHQLEYANVDLDGDDYWDMQDYITEKTIKNIIKTLKK